MVVLITIDVAAQWDKPIWVFNTTTKLAQPYQFVSFANSLWHFKFLPFFKFDRSMGLSIPSYMMPLLSLRFRLAVEFVPRLIRRTRGFNRLIFRLYFGFFGLHLLLGGSLTCFNLTQTLFSANVSCWAMRLCSACALSLFLNLAGLVAGLFIVPLLVRNFSFFPALLGFNFLFFLFFFFGHLSPMKSSVSALRTFTSAN